MDRYQTISWLCSHFWHVLFHKQHNSELCYVTVYVAQIKVHALLRKDNHLTSTEFKCPGIQAPIF